MLKNFVNGLVFGAGFSIAILLVVTAYFKLFLTGSSTDTHSVKPNVTSDIPDIRAEVPRFFGPSGSYTGEFVKSDSAVLAPGKGKIIGTVTNNGAPVKGLKLRLALNGKIMSQWALSNKLGQYVISVPIGEYKIDGYELDYVSANEVLSGLIDQPGINRWTGKFEVAPDKPGEGLALKFIEPVMKTVDRKTFHLNEPVIISWKVFPDAVKYRIQVYEKSSPNDIAGNNTIFDWDKLPQVGKNSFSLSEHTNRLKPDHYYSFQVEALDSNQQIVSQTARTYTGYDFYISKASNPVR